MDNDRIKGLAARLLADADAAAATGDWSGAESLALDVLALDEHNADAERLRVLATSSRVPGAAGDRRQLTAMFCDLVGSTDLAERFDPEVVHDMTLAYQEVCAESIERFGGSLYQFQGDGVVAFFCYPRSHDDDPLRAVLAGLEITERMADVSASTRRRWNAELTCRIGIHTGLVSVQDCFSPGRAHTAAVWGSTPNLAARLQGVAEPGTVVISDETAERVGFRVQSTSLGPHDLKGITRPVEVFRVDAARAGGPLDLPTEHLTPLVGRSTEIAALDDAWRAAREGFADRTSGLHETRVLLVGEPGVGKSRLARLARDRAIGDGAVAFQLACAPRGTQSLEPVRGALERLLGIRPDDHPQTRLDALRTRFGDRADLIPFLATVLDLPTDDLDAPRLAPAAMRSATLRALLDMVEHLTTTAPVLVVAEDVHWADPTTVEWVQRLARRSPAGMMLLVTTRPVEVERWAAAATELQVPPLSAEDVSELIQSAGEGAVPDDVVAQAVARSDGIPLFAEQLARTFSRRQGDADPAAIPGTLHDLLQAQLDAVGEAKRYAQVAATLGRDFDLALLTRVVHRLAQEAGVAAPTEAEVTAAFAQLAHSDLVVPISVGGRHLRFRHALVRDAAYDSQLLSERPARHHAIAEELAAGNRDQPAVVAFHFEWGGDPSAAIEWYLRAARDARGRGEYDEALGHLERAEALLGGIGADRRTGLELQVRTERGITVSSTQGWGAPVVVEEFTRSVELCHSVGEAGAADLVRALSGLWSYWISSGDLDRCRVVGAQLAAQLERGQAEGRGSTIHSLRGTEAFWRGDLSDARYALLQSRELYDHRRFRSSEWGLAHDLLVAVLSLLGPLLVITGDELGGLASLETGIQRANALDFPMGPFSEAYVRAYLTWVHRMQGDADRAADEADRVVQIGERYGFMEWVLVGTLHQGAAKQVAGDHDGASDSLSAALAAYRSLGGDTGSTLFLVDLADAQRNAGRLDDAAATLDDALALATDRGHGVHLAETHRSRAELAAAVHGADHPDVVTEIDAALSTAARQTAVLWELRAAQAARRLVPTHRSDVMDDCVERALHCYGPASPLLTGPGAAAVT